MVLPVNGGVMSNRFANESLNFRSLEYKSGALNDRQHLPTDKLRQAGTRSKAMVSRGSSPLNGSVPCHM